MNNKKQKVKGQKGGKAKKKNLAELNLPQKIMCLRGNFLKKEMESLILDLS